MKTQSQNYSEEMFEGKDFVQECLDSFDERVRRDKPIGLPIKIRLNIEY